MGVTLPATGSGTATPIAATDIVAGQHYQQIKIVDGSIGGTTPAIVTAAGAVKTDPSAVTQPVSAASLPLPTGAATSALQGGGMPAALGAGGGMKVDGSGTAIPVSAAALPLPAGASADGTDPVGTGAGTQAGVATVGVGIRGWLSTLAGIFQSVGAKVQGLGTAGTPAGGVVTVQGPTVYVPGDGIASPIGSATLQLALLLVTSPSDGTMQRLRAVMTDSDGMALNAPGLQTESLTRTFNGVTWDRSRTPTVFKPFSALAIGAETTIWDPGIKLFRLMGYVIAQGTLAGAITLKDGTGGTTRLVIPPNTAGVVQMSPDLGNGILSALAGNKLTATGSATETITGYVFGTEE